VHDDQASELFQHVRRLLLNASPEELDRWSGDAEEGWAFVLALLAGGRRALRKQVCSAVAKLASSRTWKRALRSSRLRAQVDALPADAKKMFEEAVQGAASSTQPAQPVPLPVAVRAPVAPAAAAARPAAPARWAEGVPDDIQARFRDFSEQPRATIGDDPEMDPELSERLRVRSENVVRQFHEVVLEVMQYDGPRSAERAPGSLFVGLRHIVLHIRALNAMKALENEREHADTVVAYLVHIAATETVKRRQVFEVMRILQMDPVWAEALRKAQRFLSPDQLDDMPDDFLQLIGAHTDPSDTPPILRCWASVDGDPALAMAPALLALAIMILILCLRLVLPGGYGPSLRLTAGFCALWPLPALLDLFSVVCSRSMALVVRLMENPAAELAALDEAARDGEQDVARPRRVLMASVEHDIIWDESNPKDCRCKAVAGGLGKVAGMMAHFHPGFFTSVHPCLPGQSYEFADRMEPLYLRVDGEDVQVEVRRWRPGRSRTGKPREYYLLDHPIFQFNRDKSNIYPCPQTARSTLRFWALWSQAVAVLIKRTRATLFHCPDFHTAMAVMYLEEPVPVVVVLHNAEYQGIISTQQMRHREIKEFSQIFCLPEEKIRSETLSEGGFNMLKPVVEYVKKHQRGFGICGVSKNYALEAIQKHAVFWGLPLLVGIENCMPEGERPPGLENDAEVFETRRACKQQIQQEYGLNQDPNARIFVFLGRWVKQKGLDYIADVLPWVLKKYSRAQFVIIGPVGDAYGSYARAKLTQLRDEGFHKQLFVYPGFMMVGKELKFACDYCIMPSRDEPFGYVDIEFGWYGAVIVGALRGGLGKLPGFYFQIFNADSAAHMQAGLRSAISMAMECDDQTFDQMSRACRRSTFPVAEWQDELLHLYSSALRHSVQSGKIANASDAGAAESRRDRRGRFPRSLATLLPLPEQSQKRPAEEFLVQESSEQEVQLRVESRLNQGLVSSAPALLEEVEWGLQMAKETDKWAVRLGRPTGGAILIDWVLAAVYTSGPVVSVVLSSLGGYANTSERASGMQSVFEASFILLWAFASRVVKPNKLMIVGLGVRLLAIIPGMMELPVWVVAAILGFVASADPPFAYFNFMGSAVGDVAKLSVRTGLLMALRKAAESLGSTIAEEKHMRELFKDLAVPLLLVFVFAPMFVLLHAPIPYHEFRLPVFDFRWVVRQKFLPLLFVGQMMVQFVYAIQVGVLQVRALSPYPWYLYGVLTAVQFVCIIGCGIFAMGLPTSAIILVRAFACFSLPSVVLQAFLLMEANGAEALLTYVDGAIVWCYALDAIAAFACGAAVASTAGTRWRFATFICAESVLGNLARAASPCILNLAVGFEWSPDSITEAMLRGSSQRSLAARLFDAAYVPCLLEVLVMVLASAFLEREATGQLWTWRQRRLVRRAVRGTSPSFSAEIRYADNSKGAVESVEVESSDGAEYRTCWGFRFKCNIGSGSGWGYRLDASGTSDSGSASE